MQFRKCSRTSQRLSISCGLREDTNVRSLFLGFTWVLLLSSCCLYARGERPAQEEFAGDSRSADSASSSARDRDYEFQAAFDRGYQYGRSSVASSADSYEKQASLGSTASYSTGYLSRYGRVQPQELKSYGMAQPEHWEANKGVDNALVELQGQLGHGKGDGKLLQIVDNAERSAAKVQLQIDHWNKGWDVGTVPARLSHGVQDVTDEVQKAHRRIVAEVTNHGHRALSTLRKGVPRGESFVQSKSTTAAGKETALDAEKLFTTDSSLEDSTVSHDNSFATADTSASDAAELATADSSMASSKESSGAADRESASDAEKLADVDSSWADAKSLQVDAVDQSSAAADKEAASDAEESTSVDSSLTDSMTSDVHDKLDEVLPDEDKLAAEDDTLLTDKDETKLAGLSSHIDDTS